MSITHQTRTSTLILNDPQPILHLCRQGTGAQAFGARATFSLCRYEASGVSSRTRMDISLANNEYDNINIMTLLSSGNVGIGTTNILSRLTVRGRYDDGNSGGLCINSFDGNVYNLRLYSFSPAGAQVSYNFQVNNQASSVNALTIAHNGNIGISRTSPICRLDVQGVACINDGTPYAPANNFMASGSLTIGGQTLNYGGGNNWTTNTAGLMLECENNTEIAVHDAGHRIASLMYFEGGLNINRITIGVGMQ